MRARSTGRERARRMAAAVTVALVMVGALPLTAGHALIGTVSGQIVKISPPPSVLPGALQDPTNMFAFDELQGVTLASPLRVDITDPGTYDQGSDFHPTTLPAGTVVDSHYLHSDRSGGGSIERIGQITFPTDILGVIVTRGKLADSDILGAPTTTYGGAYPGREMSFGGGSNTDIVVLPDLRTVQFDVQTSTGVDQARIVTKHDSAPVANAGGPYAGNEGTPIPLSATASDPDGEPISASWSLAWTGAPGTSCTATGATSLTPSVTCNDDALVTATLSVSDGVNTPVTSSAQVSVGNVAPAVGTVTVPATPVALGSSAPVSVAFSDAGTHDTHSMSVQWGDTTSSNATVSETNGAGTATASHTYGSAGLYTVTFTVTDDDLGVATETRQISVNGPPTADAGGPYDGAEGAPIGLVGTAIDPEGDPLTTMWSFAPSAIDAGGTCTSTGDTTLVPSITCTDDAVVSAQLSASDGINPAVVSTATVSVANEAPVLGSPAVTAGPVAAGSPVNLLAPFTDGGVNDTHTATVDWGDLSNSSASVSESGGSGGLSASHAYSTPGIYTVTVTVTDDDGGTDTATAQVTVNSPPQVDAGGPYVGLEGDTLSLAGTASDPDGDMLSVSWSFATTADPGTVCTPTGTGTLTPTVTCTDNANIVATLTVSDGVNPAVVRTTTITVGNSVPLVTSAVPSASPAPTGSTVSVGLTFSDSGSNDSHTATIDWGDAVSTSGSVSESGGSGTVSGSHVYATAGTYTITVTITDDNGGIATSTATVVVNGIPTAGAGGPYAGVEGAPVTLSGTATDPDADALTVSWTSNIVSSDPGTNCTLADATTLTPTITCDDDATVEVHISVTDGINAPVSDTATVEVQNAVPSVAAPSVTPTPTSIGTPVSLSASFTDPGVNDNHTATIDWGDGHTTTGSVSEVPGSGTVTGSHSYATSGVFTVKVTVNDKDGGKASATTTVVVNGAPTVDAGGPYTGSEGSATALNASVADPDGDPVGISWSFTWTGDAGTSCTATGATTLTPSVTCNDDAVVTAVLSADDGVNAAVTDSATITVSNRAPSAGTLTVPVSPVPVGTNVTALTTFTDPGTNDTHTASIAWDDTTTSTGAVSESSGSGSVSGAHAYSAPGTYTITVTISDDDGGSASTTAQGYVVVYDPSAGFVTGGGWISSPSGAYTPDDPSDADVTGKASYGFVSKYTNGSTVPTGSTEFQLHGNGLNFKSTGYAWLVVADGQSKAYYRGSGKVGNVSGYEVLVSVIDGRASGTADRFRIKIWNGTTGAVVYDNQAGAPDDASALTTISGGSIVIHT